MPSRGEENERNERWKRGGRKGTEGYLTISGVFVTRGDALTSSHTDSHSVIGKVA